MAETPLTFWRDGPGGAWFLLCLPCRWQWRWPDEVEAAANHAEYCHGASVPGPEAFDDYGPGL